MTNISTPITLSQLVARSRKLGADRSVCNWGGGNTSAKSDEIDFRGRPARILWVKGSGSDLATVTPASFTGLYLDDVLPLLERKHMSDTEMIDYLAHCFYEPVRPRPSIETLLHGFLPFTHVDHTHADATNYFACAANGEKRTGIQFLPFNTLFQLYTHERMQPGELAHACQLLMIPDLLHNWLCGSLVTERTNATTTQCWDPIAGAWVTDLLDQLAIPTSMLAPVVDAGTSLGEVLPELRSDVGTARVVAPATHDTGSAIAAATPALPGGWGYISSGTWSLVGVELQRPVMTLEALAANCTNEGGVFGTTRFLKNVMGLWLLQECQRQWARDGRATDYDTLLADVDGVPPFAALIDPDDSGFLAPDDMPAAINTYLVERGQAPLQAPAAFARCIMESLVLRYREVFRDIGLLTGAIINQVHILGGGARNTRLNQWLADALAVPVLAGPYEATARGNALMQLVGLGELHNLKEVRAIAQNAPTQIFSPRDTELAAWNEAAQRLSALRFG